MAGYRFTLDPEQSSPDLMPRVFDSLSDLINHGADTLIDVRSPAEYAEDHIPGAINLPALSNEERAEVGTMYVQDSAFKARKMGAALVARNVANHLEGPLAAKDGSWQPLVYCWRGGQRSGSFTSILQQIGWRAETVSGGYRSYRRAVVEKLHSQPLSHKLILLDGNTGTGKTEILARLPDCGVQVIDLEDLANHRGSLLGEAAEGQPSQKSFESRLAACLLALDPTRPVVVEAESSKIGSLNVPPSVWSAMCAAPRITVRADLQQRAAFLAKSYQDMADRPAELIHRLAPLRRIRGHAVIDAWQGLLAAGDRLGFARAIIEDHYDPAYEKARRAHDVAVIGDIRVDSFDEGGLSMAARAVADVINRAT